MNVEVATALAKETLLSVSPDWRLIEALHDGECWHVTLEPCDGCDTATVRVMDDGSVDILAL
jgi:hypothetical protein